MTPNVLLIDDSESIHDLIAGYYRAQWNVLSAFSGIDGLEKAKKCNPDLILLDLDLPDMNGFDVCRHLRAESNNRHLAVIFLSGCSSMDERVCGLQSGAMDFVAKPFSPAELEQRAWNAIHIEQKLRELPDSMRWCPPVRMASSGGKSRRSSNDKSQRQLRIARDSQARGFFGRAA